MKQPAKNIWIKDPIHGFIELDSHKDALFLKLLDAPEIQRLKRIQQLGTIRQVYPAAEHSRFTHILGTYATAQNTLNHFRQRGFLNSDNFRDEIEIPILAAALLHDLGHGPFSHNFELLTGLNHEQLTKAIVEGDTHINEILQQHDPTLPQKIQQLLEHKFFLPLGNSMISSQLDVDRMDYICRDSYMTGANYGFLDLQRIISVLTIYNDELVVLEKGLGTIEEYLLARFYMYWEVYFHKTSTGMALLLQNIFERARELFAHQKSSFLSRLEHRFHFLFWPQKELTPEKILKPFLLLDDHDIYYLLKQFSQSQDPILADLSRRFLHRDLFKPVELNPSNDKSRIKQMLQKEGFDPHYYYIENVHQKNIYTPNPISSRDGQGIMVLKESEQRLCDISEASVVINKLIETSYPKREYVFVPQNIRQQIKNN